MPDLCLNDRAAQLIEAYLKASPGHAKYLQSVGGARVLHLGQADESAGLLMANVCLAGLAQVNVLSAMEDARYASAQGFSQLMQVEAEAPMVPCLGSQYAGRKVAVDDFFAMGSGPFRLLWPGEELLADWPEADAERNNAKHAVVVLETGQPVTDNVVQHLAQHVQKTADQLLILAAPTASLPGVLQIVARGLETALHKLHELKFDGRHITKGLAVAPIPPVPTHDLRGIGLTNDAILYGADVTLWLDPADQTDWKTLGPQVPASASDDYGAPFYDIFKRYKGDFYSIDPLLFSPARLTVHHPQWAEPLTFGKLNTDIMAQSFAQADQK